MFRSITSGLALIGALTISAAAPAQEWKESPKIQALYKEAQKEGSVVIWGTNAAEVRWIPDAFTAAFPGIQVEILGDNDIVTKAITEARGGRHSVDVFQATLNSMIPAFERNLFTAIDWSMFGLRDSDAVLKGHVGLSHTTAYALVFRTDKFKKAELPNNWLEMADEKYRGQMVSSLFLLPRLIGGIGLEIGEQGAVEYARKLVGGSNLLLTRAPRDTFLQTGERSIALGEIDHLVRAWIANGLPVDYKILTPVITSQFGVSVMAKVPHPSAARLLAGYLASPDGRAARTKATFQFNYLPGSTDPVPAALQAAGAKIIYDTVENMGERAEIINRVSPVVTGQAR
ncbi:MAG: extracellular solute-binding protein [Bradyrhizobiaceae bacterium]|nr:extracellular solute-binding protein [Bradyrhizobiaceae bacterium]